MRQQFLREVALFADLSEGDLTWLADRVEEVRLKKGEVLFEEGQSGQRAYVICEGELEVLKESQGRNVLLAVRRAGDVIGEIALLDDAPRMATIKARSEAELLAIDKEVLDELLQQSHAALNSLFQNVLDRLRDTQTHLRQSEKMAQLGVLTSGVAHELNNPAAAIQRAEDRLATLWIQVQDEMSAISRLGLDNNKESRLAELVDQAINAAAKGDKLDALERSDRRDTLDAWVREKLAWKPDGETLSALIDVGLNIDDLEHLKSNFPGEPLQSVLSLLAHHFMAQQLLAEIGQSSQRISDIVSALKGYIHLDQAPIQEVDVREGIEDTLLIFNFKLKDGIQVERDFPEELPKIQAYGGELNQVWTNLIDNAIDAMEGQGTLRVAARQDGDWIVVEVEDNGPGIPKSDQEQVFDAFFTTKEPGEGTGMGLNIAYQIVVEKHRGDLRVHSKPGRTVFEVWLPVDWAESGETK